MAEPMPKPTGLNPMELAIGEPHSEPPRPTPSEYEICLLEKAAWDAGVDGVLVWYRDQIDQLRERVLETEQALKLADDRRRAALSTPPAPREAVRVTMKAGYPSGFFSGETTGAVDLAACRNRSKRGHCKCAPKCAVCGAPKHSSVHGPRYGEPPGSAPWGHSFQWRLANREGEKGRS